METTYKTLYSDVGRESLETWLKLGLVTWLPRVPNMDVPELDKWLVAFRSYNGLAYLYKVYDFREDANTFVENTIRSGLIWRDVEVWHIVEGTDVVEHMRREPDGELCSMRWVATSV